MKQFFEFCVDGNINVVASYIESKKNKVAEKESRKIIDNFEWTLKDKYFENLNREFGEFTVNAEGITLIIVNLKLPVLMLSYATGIRKTSMHYLFLV